MQLICQSLFTGTPDFVMKGLKKFGFEAFRAGQEHAVKRILAGKNLKNFSMRRNHKITKWKHSLIKILGGSIFLNFMHAPHQ